jgi:predicted MFS family arabinose efflux permease
MVRLTVYSFATLMDVVLSAVLFVCMVRLADMRASAQAVASMMLIWAAVYMVSSLAAGHVVTRRNAAWILIASCAATILLAAGFLAFPERRAMYGLMALQGGTTAFFFAPFQVFMKLVDQGQNKSVAHSTGLYTFSWSMGYAIGPFVAGYLFAHLGWQTCHVFNGIVAAAIAIGVYRLKHHADVQPSSQPGDDQTRGAPATAPGPVAIPTADAAPAGMPDLAWMAWVFGGIGCVIVAVIRSIFPSSGAAYNISKPDQGSILCIFSAVQAVVGLSLGRGGHWVYRPLPILGFSLFGITGLALFGIARGPGLFFAAAALVGVYSGSFYFYFVYHSLVHPERSARYVSINESIVGLASIVGPLVGGYVADRFELSTPYLGAMGLLAIGVLVQAAIHRHHTRQAALGPASLLPADS